MRVLAALSVLLFATASQAALNSWTTHGPAGGTMWEIVADPTNTSAAWLATDGSLYKTTDAGATWNAVSSFPAPNPTAIAFDPSTASTMYVGTRRHGIFRSIDSGSTWTELDMGLFDTPTVLELHAATSDEIYAGLEGNGLWGSIDGGETWDRITTLTGATVWSIASSPATPSTIYVGLDKEGVYKTTNGGATWTSMNSGLVVDTSGYYAVRDIRIDSANASILYVATERTGVARSTNAGASWTPMYPVNQNGAYPSAYSVAVDPYSASTIVAGLLRGAYRTTNGGANWNFTQFPNATYFGAMTPLKTAGTATILAGSNSGLFRSTDGGATWSTVSSPSVNAVRVASLAKESSTVLYAAGRDGVWKTTDGGATWSFPSSALAGYQSVRIARAGSNLYAIMALDGCLLNDEAAMFSRSSDGGATWSSIVRLPVDDFDEVVSLATDPANANTLYVTSGSGAFLKSTNGGTSWTQLGYAAAGPIAIDPVTPSTIYVVDGYVYKSTNGGASFNDAPLFLGSVGPNPATLLIDPADHNHIYAGLFESFDGGVQWSMLAPSLALPPGYPSPEGSIKSILIDPNRKGTLFAASDFDGVFRSDDYGATWASMNSGLVNTRVTDLTFRDANTLVAATEGSSVYEFTLPAPACQAFTLSPATIVRNAEAGSQVVTITSNPSCPGSTWTTSSTADWLQVTPVMGSGDTMTVTWTANSSDYGRKASIHVGGAAFAITQVGMCPALTATPSTISAGTDAGSQSVTLTVPSGGCSGPWTVSGLDSWLHISPSSGTGPGTITVSWDANSSSARSGEIRFSGVDWIHVDQAAGGGLTAPAGVTATYNGTVVDVTWQAVAGAARYSIFNQTTNGGPYVYLGQATTTTWSGPASPGASYMYVVRAYDSGGWGGPFSSPDLATTVAFTDDPLLAGTVAKAAHLSQLRTAIDAVRTFAGLGAATYTRSISTGIAINAVDIGQMREALHQARTALALPDTVTTDATLTAGLAIRAAHVTEIRNGVK